MHYPTKLRPGQSQISIFQKAEACSNDPCSSLLNAGACDLYVLGPDAGGDGSNPDIPRIEPPSRILATPLD